MVMRRVVLCMADETSTTVHMDGDGRITIPKDTRKALDLEGDSAYLKLDITVLSRQDGD